MYYVNRNGLVQGPYPLDSIVSGIRNGSLAGVLLCAQGANAWQPAEAFPEIAQALGAGAPPPQQPMQQSPVQPSPQQAMPPQAQQPFGPPGAQQAPWAAQAVQPTQPNIGRVPVDAKPKPKSKVLLFVGIGVVALFVFGGIAAVGAYFIFFRAASAHMAQSVPKDTTMYVEVPSIRQSIASSVTAKSLDPTKLNEKQATDDAVTAFANAFDVSQTDARLIFLSLSSTAFALRRPNDGKDGAMLLSFASNSAATTLLSAKRFTDRGVFGKAGKRYDLKPKSIPASQMEKLPAMERSLSSMEVDESSRLVWFAKSSLLVLGDEPMVTSIAAVLETGADSLEKNDAYIKAKPSFDSGASVLTFMDTRAFDSTKDADAQKMLSSYLRDRDPVTGTMTMDKAGILMKLHGKLTGDALPPDDLVPAAPKLTYPHRLPQETVAYIAYSTKTNMKGAAARAALIKHAQASNPASAKQLQDGLEQLEKQAGFTFDELVDMLGDEGAFAVIMDKDFKYDTKDGVADELSKFGLVFVESVKDDAIAKQILGKLKAAVSNPSFADFATVKPDGDGFEVDPQTSAAMPLPSLKVEYKDKQIIVVLAAAPLADRALAALEQGKGTLKDEPAAESAFSALMPDAHSYWWIDTGRLASVLHDSVPAAKATAASNGVPIDAIRLTGPDRITTAIGMRYTVSKGVWAVDIDMLNMPGLAVLSGADQLDMPSPAAAAGGIFGGMNNRGGDADSTGGGGSKKRHR